ncbi:MAG: ATP-binding cassette domain-containing protein, partial [Lachnospiraceae bacterium]|nr:ATP-binding cassette domain-containing protein [Lachnospiraceae bacterium]
MLLQVNHISMSFSGKDILKDCSFHMEDREKRALIGINGAGKSTLLKIIVGQLTPEDGSVTFASGASYGYLSQQEAVRSDRTIYEEILAVKQDILAKENSIRILEQEMKHLSGEELDTAMRRYSTLTHEFEMGNGYA